MKKTFSFKDRKSNIQKLSQNEFDLIIIGGGINGAGVARDAAQRGMKVALVEGSDYASGTSSRSSKLVHGGIRYLENMEFKLVFEALSEREKLFQMAPHLVHPLRFFIPIYKDSRVGMFKMGLGMWLYDLLSLFRAPQMHERLDAEETLERMSILENKDLVGSYVYSDAYMDDDRLVIETLRSANDYGAVCVNYVQAVGALMVDGKINGVVCEDKLSGKKIEIKGKTIVSSVGPWTDLLGSKMIPNWKKVLRPTKGVHLTFHKNRLPINDAVVMAVDKENRIVFGIPRHEMIIIGTTDTDYKELPENVVCTKADVEYLIGVINEYFPNAEITERDIVASYAGVRPLVADDSETEGKTSREHTIWKDDSGVIFVAGGKYTTYRLIAEEVVEKVLESLPIEEKVKFNNSKSSEPLNPDVTMDALLQARILVPELVRQTALSESQIQLLVDRFGLEVVPVIKKLAPGVGVWEIEAYYAIEQTMCLNLVDFYTRRTPLFLSKHGHGLEFLSSVSQVFANEYSWSPEQVALEKKRLHDFIAAELDWRN